MRNYLFIAFGITFLFACTSDEQKQKDFAGTYQVTMEIPGHQQEMETAEEDMKQEMEQAREEMRQEMEQAREEIEQELGEESGLGKALGNFVEGMGKLAEGMTELGESLGQMGINLGTSILEDIRFNATFRENGEVEFGKRKGIRIQMNDELRWKIEGDEMILWNENEGMDHDPQRFKIEKKPDNRWDLTSDDLIMHLRKEEK